MPVRQDLEVLPADEPRQLHLGWVVNEVIGVAVVNPRGIQRLTLGAADGDEEPRPPRQQQEPYMPTYSRPTPEEWIRRYGRTAWRRRPRFGRQRMDYNAFMEEEERGVLISAGTVINPNVGENPA